MSRQTGRVLFLVHHSVADTWLLVDIPDFFFFRYLGYLGRHQKYMACCAFCSITHCDLLEMMYQLGMCFSNDHIHSVHLNYLIRKAELAF